MVPVLEILEPGLLTLVEDLGRWGYQRYGVSASGAMDLFSHRAANRLVANADGEATLECTVIGPKIRVLADTALAITGADLRAQIDGRSVGMWETVFVREGNVLSFGRVRGCRFYIAVSGGLDVAPVLGSRATHLSTRLGGYQGRKLSAGDVLGTSERQGADRLRVRRALAPQRLPDFLSRREVRALPGPQADFFSEQEMGSFFRDSYRVQLDSDRVAIRLDGRPLKHRECADIVSDPSPLGAVQVPAGGKPMVLMADRPTTGGYPKIANVIAADLPVLAQLKPGDEIRFAACGLDEALAALQQMEEAMESLCL